MQTTLPPPHAFFSPRSSRLFYSNFYMFDLKVLDIVTGNNNIQKAKLEVPRGFLRGWKALFQLGA